MFKKLVLVTTIVAVVSFLLYHLHSYVLIRVNVNIEFSLINSYFFYFLWFLVAVGIIEIVYYFSPIQLGFTYLGVILIKLVLFAFLFNNVLFSEDPASMPTKLSMVIPLFVYITFETLYCAKKLKKVNGAM